MVLRSLVRIDEEKCTGCGLCILACAEELETEAGLLRKIEEKAGQFQKSI